MLAKVADNAVELVAGVALTLAFFGAFLVLLGIVFPAGESLRSLALEGNRVSDLSMFTNPGGSLAGGGATGATIGSLEIVEPDVKRRAAETITWGPARDGQALRDRDAVQTGANGRAVVHFGPNNELQVERNSLVIVMAPHTAPAGSTVGPDGDAAPAPAGRRAAARDRPGAALIQGEFVARLQAHGRSSMALALPNVVATLDESRSHAPATFRMTVAKDHSATVAVLAGRLKLESRSGVVSLGPRQFSHVSVRGEAAPASLLLEAPAWCSPDDQTTYPMKDLPPRVTFSWSGVPGASGYRVRVARDAGFSDVVLDETVESNALTWGRAEPGAYWWQVAGMANGVEGIATHVHTIIVDRNGPAPKLDVDAPSGVVTTARQVISGFAERSTRVFVMGYPAVLHPDGTFRIELELQPGANVLVVEAVDESGRTSYWSRVVHLKP